MGLKKIGRDQEVVSLWSCNTEYMNSQILAWKWSPQLLSGLKHKTKYLNAESLKQVLYQSK